MFLCRLENSSEIQQPFYMQFHLLQDKESNLERIFNPKPEKIADNVPSPADIRLVIILSKNINFGFTIETCKIFRKEQFLNCNRDLYLIMQS